MGVAKFYCGTHAVYIVSNRFRYGELIGNVVAVCLPCRQNRLLKGLNFHGVGEELPLQRNAGAEAIGVQPIGRINKVPGIQLQTGRSVASSMTIP